MTKIAIITATEGEMAPIRATFGDLYIYSVTGIGATATAIATLALIDAHKPDLILQTGIAGAIDPNLALLDAVIVASDYQADLGAWRGDHFERFDSPTIEYPYVVDQFRSVRARSVTTACAQWIHDDAQIESMEGAAFMAAAKSRSVRFMQMRVISNFITTPREEWKVAQAIADIPKAINALLANQ